MPQDYSFLPLFFHVNVKMPFLLTFYMLPRMKKDFEAWFSIEYQYSHAHFWQNLLQNYGLV